MNDQQNSIKLDKIQALVLFVDLSFKRKVSSNTFKVGILYPLISGILTCQVSPHPRYPHSQWRTVPPQPDRHHWVRTAAQNCSNITRLAIFPQISKYFSKYSNTTRLAIFFQGRILHEGRGTGLPKCFTYQQCRPGAFTSVYSFKIKILVKLDSVSPPPRMATSTLSLQSRRTTSRRTRLLPGVSKIFLSTKSSQRDPRASARCGAGAGRDEHHQCGGGRLRGDHHLHPGGGVQLFLMQFQGGKFGDKWKDWTAVPHRLQPGRTRKVDKEQNHPDPRSTKDFNVAICLHPPRSNMLTPTQANECLARRQMPRSPSRHPGHLHCWGTSTSTSLQFQINPGQLHCWGHPSYYSIKLYSGCADLIPWL